MSVTRLVSLAVMILLAAFCQISNGATYVKVADEWGTIQTAGPRLGNNGVRGWNIEGFGASPTFASSGTLRFYMADLVAQLNTTYPSGWQINNVTLVAEHFDAAFSVAGSISIFHVTNDTIKFTSGATVTDPAPSDFSALGVSDLRYSDTGTADGDAVRLVLADASPLDLGTVTKLNDYNFAVQGNGNLDVFGTPDALVNPAGAINAGPAYSLDFPTVNTEDTLETFTTELAADAGDWSAGAVSTIATDIQSGTDALSFIFAPTTEASTATATYNGSVNTAALRYPPRIYFDVTAATPAGVQGDYNGNGVVDGADYVLWRNGGPLANDPTTGVQEADYAFWRSRFGATSGSGSELGGIAVPEPATAVLLLCGLAAVVGRRR